MKDFVPLGTGNSRNLKSAVPAGTTWEQALAMLRNGTFPIDLGAVNDAGVAQKGDPLNQETLLKAAVAALYGKDNTSVPSDIFEILSKAALYENGVIKDVAGGNAMGVGNCQSYTDTYIGNGATSLSIQFPHKLLALFIFPDYPSSYRTSRFSIYAFGGFLADIEYDSMIRFPASISADGKTITISSGSDTGNIRLNNSGENYHIAAILYE